ncbi:hypothetical protein ACTZGB_01310 [Yersinia bercovieri]|uniref:hypothetical protein n=1 Tax=Yersinia TaxID=629 RepID=UPI0005E2DD31|nr:MULTISPECIES: hypothetical protein [Yersinia]MDA5548613.1 hypothetical protein [Yersinia massiliensis]PHZ22612.1 hypothetical protein CS535_15870 [Yersinia massiliensis]UZM79550.1 hypothetical protein OP862_02350 [Yersinia massiliensis]CQD62890.1 Uncharacterised protein [Yersinia enterocolitica]
MKKRILVALLIAGFSSSAIAVKLNGKYPVCESADAFERLSAIIQHQDEAAFKTIMQTECFMPKVAIPVDKVVTMGITTGVAQVKIYHEGQLFDLWTNSESLKAD